MSMQQPVISNPQSSDTSSGMGGLFGVAAVALVAMGLLTYGYSTNKHVDTAQAPAMKTQAPMASTMTPSTTPSTTTTGMAPAAGKTADTPTAYQPAAPAADTRSSPTSSSTGIGPDNGGPQPGAK